MRKTVQLFNITDGSEFPDIPYHGRTGLSDFKPYRPMTIKHTKRLSVKNTTFGNIWGDL